VKVELVMSTLSKRKHPESKLTLPAGWIITSALAEGLPKA
jgi:hypothetical protein